MKEQFESWRDILKWVKKHNFNHLADRMELNNKYWMSSGEFGRNQVYICDSIRFAENEEEALKIAKKLDKEMEANYGLW